MSASKKIKQNLEFKQKWAEVFSVRMEIEHVREWVRSSNWRWTQKSLSKGEGDNDVNRNWIKNFVELSITEFLILQVILVVWQPNTQHYLQALLIMLHRVLNGGDDYCCVE